MIRRIDRFKSPRLVLNIMRKEVDVCIIQSTSIKTRGCLKRALFFCGIFFVKWLLLRKNPSSPQNTHRKVAH